MILTTIISGGQTGVDRGALDAAIELGIDHGGWCPSGRRAEDGVIPDKYKLSECLTGDYATRTIANVKDSDCTVIVREPGPIGPGTRLTIKTVQSKKSNWVDIDLSSDGAVTDLAVIFRHYPVVNFAGSRESTCPGIQEKTRKLIVDAYNRNKREDDAYFREHFFDEHGNFEPRGCTFIEVNENE